MSRRLSRLAVLVLAPFALLAPLAPAATAGAGVSSVPVGSYVCLDGPVGGYRCGVVTAVNVTVHHAGGTLYGLTRTSVCVYPGEAGSPFYTAGSSTRVVGHLVGGTGSGSACSSFYDPV